MFKEEYNANFGVLLSFSEHKTLPATNGQVSISNYILSHFTGTWLYLVFIIMLQETSIHCLVLLNG